MNVKTALITIREAHAQIATWKATIKNCWGDIIFSEDVVLVKIGKIRTPCRVKAVMWTGELMVERVCDGGIYFVPESEIFEIGGEG